MLTMFMFNGIKHSAVPDLDDIRKGVVDPKVLAEFIQPSLDSNIVDSGM